MKISEILIETTEDLNKLPRKISNIQTYVRGHGEYMVFISIGDMKFQMILSDGVGAWPGNLWWGMVPKTNTKAKLDKYRNNFRTGIMKILEPMLRRAMVKLILGTKPNLFTVIGSTNKAQNLYKSWAKYIEEKTGYEVDDSYNRGILVKKSKSKMNEGQLSIESKEMVELIRRDCKPWLEQSAGNLVYRGMKNKARFIKKKVRKDRRPLASPKLLHNYVEDKMKKMRLNARRTNSVFVSGSLAVAHGYGGTYGGPYVIFPIGNFDFTWSPVMDDLFNYLPRFWQDKPSPDQYEILDSRIGKYIDHDLIGAIKSWNEIMVKCDSYYAVEYSWYNTFFKHMLFTE